VFKLIRIAAVFCCALLLTLVLSGQTTTTGAINGVISDPSGAIVPGATVTLTSTTTDAKRTAKSSASGSYRFDLLAPGSYTIAVDQPGFTKLESKVQVDNSQVLSADLKLVVGSDAQTVDVESVASLINAENGNVATTIGQLQAEEVPNSGNNITYVNKLTPGMNTNFGVVGNTSYQIDGENFNDPYNNANNSGASNLTLGLNDVSEATVTGNGYSGQFGGLVGANVSVVTKAGGNRVHGNLNYFWTGRSLIANTYTHKITTPITPRSFQNANQWSGLISGPVFIPHLFNGHDKLFFLADAEGLRAILPGSPSTVALPSPNLQAYTLKKLVTNGLSASVPYYQNMFRIYNAAAAAHGATAGNTTSIANTATFPNATATGCPTAANTLSAADLLGLGFTNAGGVYTGPAGACGLSYGSSATTYANEALEIFRVDAIISTRDKFFVRYEHDSGAQPTTIDPIDPLFNAISIQPQHSGQFNETHTIGSRGVNNLIVGGLWYGALFGPANLAASLAEFPAQLGLSDGSLSTLGGSNASFPTGRNITTIQLQDDVALNYGAHTLKFGGKGYEIKENDHYFTAGTVPNETVASLGAFINGGLDPATCTTTAGVKTCTKFTTFAQTFPTKTNHPVLINQQAYYVEDDWKASRNLNVTASLRLEHQGNIQCIDNCVTQLVTPFTSLTHDATIPYNQAYAFNTKNVLPGLQSLEWQPRIGFAYNPSIFHESLVLRGGYGIFYDGLPGSVLEGVAKNPPTKNSFSVTQDNLANTETTSNLWTDTTAFNAAYIAGVTNGGTVASIRASLPTAAERAAFTPPSAYFPQGNFKMYNVQKWNLELQKSFGPGTVISINYLGNHGTHKPFTNAGLNADQANTTLKIAGLPAAPTAALPIDPRFGTVYYYQSGGSNNYNGVIVTATQKFRGGSIITAGYTYGKILDNSGATLFSTTSGTGTTDIASTLDPYHPGLTYAPASTDERHNFTMNYVYRVPWKNDFYGGWEVSGTAFAYSGLPFSVIDTATTTSISGYTTGAYGGSLLATYKGGGQASCGYGAQQCLSASQFGPATSVGLNGPRNAFRGPMYVNTDLSVTKQIPLHWEGGHLTVSAQAFNALNHLNFSRPTGSLSSSTFGKITSVLNPSGIFSGVGGDDSPRILQLKANVTF
jgi:hypothetical protein